jgi:hypothetical protein
MLGAVARLHARWWDRGDRLPALPFPSLSTATDMFTRPSLTLLRGEPPADEHSRFMIEDFVIGRYLPAFVDRLGPADADFYQTLLAERARWVDALAALPPTFNHGDLRRANIAYLGDRVGLFDWDLAAWAPAALDLQWYWFLQFWVYPADGLEPADREPLREHYLAELAAARGAPIDRAEFDRSWDLAWLRTIAVLGYLLVDPLIDGALDPGPRAAAERRLREAIAAARRAADRL